MLLYNQHFKKSKSFGMMFCKVKTVVYFDMTHIREFKDKRNVSFVLQAIVLHIFLRKEIELSFQYKKNNQYLGKNTLIVLHLK